MLNKIFSRIKETLESYKRVLFIAKKPDLEEFKKVSKICAIGMVILGFIGFLIYAFSILFLS
ncbi:MAG: protein translocase SEC61 complex subunit gamma [Candidatus Aenigmatarchaeota archaeon]